jgi:hypothetical protein
MSYKPLLADVRISDPRVRLLAYGGIAGKCGAAMAAAEITGDERARCLAERLGNLVEAIERRLLSALEERVVVVTEEQRLGMPEDGEPWFECVVCGGGAPYNDGKYRHGYCADCGARLEWRV